MSLSVSLTALPSADVNTEVLHVPTARDAIGCKGANLTPYDRVEGFAATQDDAAKSRAEPAGEGSIGKQMSHEHRVHDGARDVYSTEL